MMPTFREDVDVYPAMIELSSCLCVEIEKSGLPGTCACGPMIGALTLDYCTNCKDGSCGGQAWVRLSDVFPSRDFPNPDAEVSNCNSPMAFTLEVGVTRCKPQGTNSQLRGYVPPTLEQNVEALRLQLADMAAIRRAIQCCFADSDRSYLVGRYQQLPVNGDCLGGYFTVTVWSM